MWRVCLVLAVVAIAIIDVLLLLQYTLNYGKSLSKVLSKFLNSLASVTQSLKATYFASFRLIVMHQCFCSPSYTISINK